jgi:thioredoxin reductase
MVEELQKHLSRFDIRIQYSEFRIQNYLGGVFVGECDGKTYTSQYLVIATGTKAKHSGEGYTEVYPIRNVKGKRIAIIGAGDAAFDYAMSLVPQNTVHIHNRGSKIKCIPALLEIALKQDGITYFENSVPSGSYDYTIFATGREPDLRLLSDEMINIHEQLEQDGLIYVIGDVKNGMLRQSSIAIGDGIRAAMAIVDKIKHR